MSRKQSASVSSEPESFKGKRKPRVIAGYSLNPEEELQHDIVKWLRDMAPQIDFHHSPNQLARDSRQRIVMSALGMHPGYPDLVLEGPDFHAFIEVKTKGKYPTPDQRQFLAKRRAEGKAAYIVRSIDDLKAVLNAHGIKTREDLFPKQEALF